MPTILFAEDKPGYHKEVLNELRAAGFTVIAVDNGTDALVLLDSHHFDLVLTDFCMPGAEGDVVAKKALTKGIQKIIINSAMSGRIDPIPGVTIVPKMEVPAVLAAVQQMLST